MPSPSPRRRHRNGYFAGGLQVLLQKHALLTVLHSLLRLAAAHQTTSPYPQEVLGEWKPGRATYYSVSDPRDTVCKLDRAQIRLNPPSLSSPAMAFLMDGVGWISQLGPAGTAILGGAAMDWGRWG